MPRVKRTPEARREAKKSHTANALAKSREELSDSYIRRLIVVERGYKPGDPITPERIEAKRQGIADKRARRKARKTRKPKPAPRVRRDEEQLDLFNPSSEITAMTASQHDQAYPNRPTHPAFPNQTTDGSDKDAGMSLLAYFMAHAPAEPQPWFKPEPDEPEPMPYIDGSDAPRPERYTSADATIPNRANHAHVDWKRRLDRARYVQWPRAWALAQIEQLNK
ncbi:MULTISPECIES: hypothetical protein [Pseudomonas]|uniref:Uncharacterized protein n=1 Tax=Pseudomonas lutea TaxID=243924 RepID=A0A9X8QLR2_9PSED|nr:MULTISPECIES: hypothetical protein [Pseudomonas]SER36937.1 hypothetical protein SAMN05216409_11874 [Pseudomonas lutea]